MFPTITKLFRGISGAENADTFTQPHKEIASNGWHIPYNAKQLLNTPKRQKLLSLIWQRVSMDKTRFDNLYLQAINNYVEIVQLLPASESHHHSYLGGMIDHGLEVINYALKLRQSYLLPIGGDPEDIPRQTEAWSAAVMYGALLHDIGKVVVDISVEMDNGQIWTPWTYCINLPYRFIYYQKRDYSLHQSAAALMVMRIVPEEGMTWLSQFPDLFPLFLNLSSGHLEKAGVLAEIIQKADMSSVSNNLGGDPTKALVKPIQSLMSKMITSIRYLVSSELSINGQHGSDGWFDGTDIWLVSKTFTDKMKANLLQNGITDAPTDNAKIFNILKEHGIALANSENKTVWACRVESDTGLIAEKLTLIRIPANVAYSNITHAPEPFKGTVTPLLAIVNDNPTDTAQPKSDLLPLNHSQNEEPAPQSIQNSQLNPISSEADNKTHDLNDAVLGLFNTEIAETTHHVTPLDREEGKKITPQSTANIDVHENEEIAIQHQQSEISDEIYNHPFFKWVRSQIIAKKLTVNTQTACIHTVENKLFIVTPKLFQKYSLHINGNDDYDNWRKVQLEFQSFKIHLKFSEENFNIWKCLISGKRKKNVIIKGYLIEEKRLFSIDTNLPNNPHLTLIHDIDTYKNNKDKI
ncbi:MobH family relaxase [Orbus sturtevantii]|uniref:MobH family relaxase n=1 Tax=Orbus sturtevantii TaxID=3074109 RepID=UPI00370D47ED